MNSNSDENEMISSKKLVNNGKKNGLAGKMKKLKQKLKKNIKCIGANKYPLPMNPVVCSTECYKFRRKT